MSKFVIEEVIKNSIDRDTEGNPIDKILFTVVSWQGRNFLYVGKFNEQDWLGDSKIAECVSGDYRKRYGDIKGWLKSILKRTDNRLEKIMEQRQALQDECDELYELKYKLWEVL
ncbi:hypothetical protein [Vibrio phage JSF13]|jgi:hypothetical protein|uniref:Uncharacterized protein ORF149 n=1 Tax=Vibrio phage ICP1 TaxID=979525 RepID=F1D1H2_9CAUD|nr:hypothetical protein ViPhICP1_gp150 [Vibrio phage ICP1]ADX89329.1 hypothetical protein TUST1-2_00745 [Vibrio phage ICP1_2001_A]APD17993.1 hypothetical protein [Vibrio phage JSF4]ASV41800.1 hypothetical protein [Vibrio phage JSF1]ASV41940.1 hypothetical protein [Vibrio phage JSF2]ASV42132.1 hypothetical protein [Vibrio phage JSF13]ASV42516.1 hypothetical protein [Vibrio phage JSF14]ASV42658.1 hypothetical protein [Vibrio phage JSF17]AXY82242.1 hypothetical protein ICP12011A_148 [Vibrio ph